MEHSIRLSSIPMIQNPFMMEVKDSFGQPSTPSYFQNISGLRINKDETRAMLRLGPKVDSQEQLCLDHNLRWKQDPLKISGIVFIFVFVY